MIFRSELLVGIVIPQGVSFLRKAWKNFHKSGIMYTMLKDHSDLSVMECLQQDLIVL